MNYKFGNMVAAMMFLCGLGTASEIPSEQQLAEIRSQRSGAEMRVKAMLMAERIHELRRAASQQQKEEIDRRISTVLLDAPPTFGAKGISPALRTQFLKMMPGFHALQPDVRLWDALANHLRAAAYISPNAFDGKMAEAKAKDERLIAEGKITRPPCHFGYPNTPNMAMVQREKWAAENWNSEIASYRMSLLEKYTPLLAGYLQGLDEIGISQFRRHFSERARLSPKEEERFFGASCREEIDKAIALAPAMMLSQTDDVGAYIRQTCDKIAKLPNKHVRYDCFRKFMKSACKVKLEHAEDMVPLQPIEMPEVEEFRREHLRKVLQNRASRFREMKIASIRGGALGRLRLMAETIYSCLLLEMPVPAPSAEQLEPYFKLIEKLHEEERREGRVDGSLCDYVIEQVENNFIRYLKSMKYIQKIPDPNDLAAVEARFRQLIGRPIRSAEQYEADSRRRVMKNIQRQKERDEAKRKRQEQQKRQEGEK